MNTHPFINTLVLTGSIVFSSSSLDLSSLFNEYPSLIIFFMIINLTFGIGLFIFPFFFYRRYRNPLVVKLTQTPNAIYELTHQQLQEAQERCESIGRWESLLGLAKLSKEDVERTLAFYEATNEEKAQQFAKQIGAKECRAKGEFFELVMGDSFDLNSINTLLLYLSDENAETIKRATIEKNEKVFVLAHEKYADEIAKLAHDKTNRIVATTQEELTALMLSRDGEAGFIKALSHCLAFKDVSPYQLKGDVKNESNFFGRVEILREIIANNSVNYLLVGARQLGKSSLLMALKRRYDGHSEVNCYAFTLDENGDVLSAMSEALGLEGEQRLEEIVRAIKAQKKKPIFLIDEADMFVKHEKESGYLITSVFRKLSQEGSAMFILAGFWTLYEYVTLDYQSPLKNFGKLITLKGLEKEACRELMMEPMRRIGVRYEDESIIDETIELCGQRANYIATICDEILRGLETLVITKKALEEALESEAVEQMLKGWGTMSANEQANRLDRLIVYLTIKEEQFRLGFVVEALKAEELSLEIEQINESLERLVLGYVLGKRKGDYSYQIPLMKRQLLEDDLEFLIEGEVEGLRC